MKKTLFLAAALGVAATASAQTYVNTTDLRTRLAMFPGTLCVDGQPRFVFFDNGESTYRVTDKMLQEQTTVNIPTDSVDLFDKLESLYEGVWDEAWAYTTRERVVPVHFGYQNFNNGMYANSLILSQTLFNMDDEFEYLMPVFLGTFSYEYEETGVQNRITKSACPVLNIMSENGSVLGAIEVPQGYYSFDHYDGKVGFELYHIGDVMYLVFEVIGQNYERDYGGDRAWYRIDRQTQSIDLVQVTPMSVRPTVAERGQDIIVELGEGSQATELQVVNTLGQTVKRVNVQPGQREVRIDTSDLGRGMNFVGSRHDGAVKIIVR